jgi:hypothetical protein
MCYTDIDVGQFNSVPKVTEQVISNRISYRLLYRGFQNLNHFAVLPEGKRPLGRPRRRWVDSIKMDLREIGWHGRDWIELAQDRDQWRALVNTAMNLQIP